MDNHLCSLAAGTLSRMFRYLKIKYIVIMEYKQKMQKGTYKKGNVFQILEKKIIKFEFRITKDL